MRKLIFCSAMLLLLSPVVMADYVLSSNDNWVRRFTDDFATQLWSTTVNNAASTVLIGPNGDVYVMRITGHLVDHLDYETGAYIGTVAPDVGSTVNVVGGGTVALESGGSANAESITFGDIGGPAGFGLAHADGVPDLIVNRRDKIEIYDGTSLEKTGTGSETWGTLLFQKYRADVTGEDGTGGQGVAFGPNYGLPGLYVMKGVNSATGGVYESRFHIYDLSSPSLEDVAYTSGQGHRDSGTMILGPDANGDGQKDLWSLDNRYNRINAYDPITGDRVVTGIPIVDSQGVAVPSAGLRFPTSIAYGPNGSILVTTRFRTWLDPSWTGAEQAGGNLIQLVWDKANLRAVATLLYELPNDTGRLDGVAYIGTNLTVARDPSPENGAPDAIRDTLLSWTPGQYAATHDVYFGTSSADVETADRANPLNVLVRQDQEASVYDPGRLEFSQTYYWRIDEVNAAPNGDIFKGDVWSFTVEPMAYPIENIIATASIVGIDGTTPQNTVDGSGLTGDLHSNDGAQMWLASAAAGEPVWIQYEFDTTCKLNEMWVWNYNSSLEPFVGFGFKDVTIEYSMDGVAWTQLADVQQFAQAQGAADYAPGAVISFDGIVARFVRINALSNWSGALPQYGLSEVRFYYIPLRASNPQPASDATGIKPDVVLSWRAGREAATHELYMSTSREMVADPGPTAPTEILSQNSYAPTALELGLTYYWKVNEVNTAEAVTTWEGPIWSLTTADYLVVDDFETYANNSPRRVFQTWIDGAGFSPDEFFPNGNDGNGTGSFAGYDPQAGNIMETATVHGGAKSMPLEYHNAGGVTISEATRTFEEAQDWTGAGIRTLVLYFYGDPNNGTAQLYVKINGTRIDYTGDANDVTHASWNQWNVDLSAVPASALQSVTTLTIGVANVGEGKLLIDDIRLYNSAPDVQMSY
jgi:hypothetical protein